VACRQEGRPALVAVLFGRVFSCVDKGDSMCRACSRRMLLAFALVALLLAPLAASGETLGRHGAGWLEEIDGYLVLHLEGTHREMGEQHGKLLADHIKQNVDFLVHEKGSQAVAKIGPLEISPAKVIPQIVAIQRPHVAQKYWDEL